MSISPKYRESLNKAVGEKIALRRRELGFRSQASFAEAIGADRVTVSRWETGASGISSEYYDEIKRVLKIDDSYFFKDTPNPKDFVPLKERSDKELFELVEQSLNRLDVTLSGVAEKEMEIRALKDRIKALEAIPDDIRDHLENASESELSKLRAYLGISPKAKAKKRAN